MRIGQQTVLVTGASSGIGRAIAVAFHRAGSRVLATGRDCARLEVLAREHAGMRIFVADLRHAEERERLIEEVAAREPALSILVNNAGVQYPQNHVSRSMERHGGAGTIERAREEIALNCEAVVHLTHGLFPRLAAAPEAAVVMVSSGLALAPKRSAPVYCATKAFVRIFAKALRHQCEAGAPHVRVIDVVPPVVDTPMTAGRGRRKLPPEAVAGALLAGLKRDAREIFVGKAAWLPWVQRLSPALADRLLRDA